MTVIQQFEYTWPEGTTPIQFHPWISTLTQAEQDEFALALERQEAYKQQWIDNGLLTLIPEGYEWKDENALKAGKPSDPVWQTYWNRWIAETGVQFSFTTL